MAAIADIIIISYKHPELTIACLNSLNSATGKLNINPVVIDNNSGDDTVETIKSEFPHIHIIENSTNLGYAGAVNKGAKFSDSKYIIISNSDVEYYPHSIEKMITFMEENPDVAVCGPQQVYPDGSWQYCYGDYPGIKQVLKEIFLLSGVRRYIKKKKFQNNDPAFDTKKCVQYIDGAVMAVRRSDFNAIKGFDEDYFFYTEETDFCRRIDKFGKKCVYLPGIRVMHHRGGSTGANTMPPNKADIFVSSKVLFCKKHNSSFYCRIYIVLEIIHNFIKLVLWKLLGFAVPAKKKPCSGPAGFLQFDFKSMEKKV